MKLLYFVPMLAVLGFSLQVHADSEENRLQVWIDYVNEYRQYMEDYKQWAADRFEYYQNQISELADQLDENNNLVQELEEDIQDRNERIQELEKRIKELAEEERSINHPANKPEITPNTNTQNHITEQDPQQEKEECYLTADKQTYTIGDIIRITAKVCLDEYEFTPVGVNLNGETVYDRNYKTTYFKEKSPGASGHATFYTCTYWRGEEAQVTQAVCRPDHRGLYSLISHELDVDDGTFLVKWERTVTENALIGEYSVAGGPGRALYNIIPP